MRIMQLREWGAMLLGEATAPQIFMAVWLGTLFGFIPGFAHAPLLYLLIILGVLLFRINLAFALLSALLMTMLAAMLTPVSYALGGWLLNGPVAPLFAWLVNTPVLAWAGLEYYLVSGSLVTGAVSGAVGAALVVWALGRFRRLMASISRQSTRWQKLTAKWWVKLLSWLLLGKSVHRIDWQALLQPRRRQPFRLLGVAVIVVLGITAVLAHQALERMLGSQLLVNQLQRINGATVTLKEVNLNMLEGRLTIGRLAAADSDDLGRNRFVAQQIVADIAMTALLRKRLMFERVAVARLETDTPRHKPARRYVPRASTQKAGGQQAPGEAPASGKMGQRRHVRLDHYLQHAGRWQQRLHTLQRVFDTISTESGADKPAAGQTAAGTRTRADTSRQRYGYANSIATHLLHKSPAITIQKLEVQHLQLASLKKRRWHLRARYLATEPALLAHPAHISVRSQQGDHFSITAAASTGQADNTFRAALKQYPAAPLLNNLKPRYRDKVEAQHMDIRSNGHWRRQAGTVSIDWPVTVTLHQVRLQVGKAPLRLAKLPVHFTLGGSLEQPDVSFDADQWHDIMTQAAGDTLKNHLKEKLKGAGKPFF